MSDTNISLSDLRGIAPNATGDLSSEEFVRRIREGWTPPWKKAHSPGPSDITAQPDNEPLSGLAVISDITTEQMLDLMESMHNHLELPLTTKGEADFRAVVTRLTDYARLEATLRDQVIADGYSVDALKAEVERLENEVLELGAELTNVLNDRVADELDKHDIEALGARAEKAEAELMTRKEIMAEDFLEITRLKAELALARPLLEAVEKANPEHLAMDENWTELTFTPCQDVGVIIREARAYRRAKEAADGKK